MNDAQLIPYPPTDAAIKPLVHYWNTAIMGVLEQQHLSILWGTPQPIVDRDPAQ